MQKKISSTVASHLIEQNQRTFGDIAQLVFDKYHQGAKGDLDKRQKELECLLVPLKESLSRFDEHTREIECRREGAYRGLLEQIDSLKQAESQLRFETANLAKALKSPNIRGSWGQIHLRRVVEIAGLSSHCDFFEQPTLREEEKIYRPDLVIRLPGNRQIVIDAKTPIQAYLEAVEMVDEEKKKQKLKEHASQLRKQVKELSSKRYWKLFSPCPDYVILFLPSESFFSAAVDIEPTLIEESTAQRVLIATPTTLIAILRSIAYVWHQEGMSQNAHVIAKIGEELYERLTAMNLHFTKLGKALEGAIDSYNASLSLYESKIFFAAKKLKETAILSSSDSILMPSKVEKSLHLPRERDIGS